MPEESRTGPAVVIVGAGQAAALEGRLIAVDAVNKAQEFVAAKPLIETRVLVEKRPS